MLGSRTHLSAQPASSWEEVWEASSYYERVANLLEQAENYAVFTGWQVDSRLPMPRPSPTPGAPALGRETLKEKVVRLCDAKPNLQIFFLAWDHEYFYILERELMQGRTWSDVHPRVHFIFDNRHPYGASHHEKIAIIDGKTALVGGIDLCDERWDSHRHLYNDKRRSLDWRHEHHGPYHDLAVQVTGPVCAEIQAHVGRRWKLLSTIPYPDAPVVTSDHIGERDHCVYVSRTVAPIDGGAPGERGIPIIREIEFLMLDLIKRAERRLVLEGQYYWSRPLNDAIIHRLRELAAEGKAKDFEILIVLPDSRLFKKLVRQMAKSCLDLLRDLQRECARLGVKITVGIPEVEPPANLPAKPKFVYVHSKLMIVDDRYVCIGSANFADRAFRVDTELNLTLEARTDAERAHIEKLVATVRGHWREAPVRLRPLDAAAELRRFRLLHPYSAGFPWRPFFDPKVPWLYPLKLKFRNWTRTRRSLVATLIVALLLVGPALVAALTDARDLHTRAYALILGSAWWLPLPFIPLSILASLELGGDAGGHLAVIALWVCALLSYFLTRMFPTTASRYFRHSAPARLRRRMGSRSFHDVLIVLADPLISIRAKLAYQGLYTIPAPWFVVGTLLVIPSALWLLCRHLVGPLAGLFGGPVAIALGGVTVLAPWFLGLCVAWGIFNAWRAIRTHHYGKANAQDPLVQHPQGVHAGQPGLRTIFDSRSDPDRPRRSRVSPRGDRRPQGPEGDRSSV